jgi:SMI1-KNR4 cell-wall
MTAEDLDRIEREIGLRLPDDYRRAMQSYPFDPRSFAYHDMLPNDAQSIINANLEPHYILGDAPPTRDYLWIGCDGGEVSYYLHLRTSPCPVHAFDLETGELTRFASNLDDFVTKCSEIDSEIEEDERRAADRKWWQFWR